jgi:hypothetical protein
VTSGSIPAVPGYPGVTAALRGAVVADERAYAKTVPRAVNSCSGVYDVRIDRALLSASTVVVSALLPHTALYPCGNDGQGWISATVLVPSGRRVRFAQLLSDRGGGVEDVATQWFRAAAPQRAFVCVVKDLPAYRPERFARNWALTPRGLAIGFWQEPACARFVAVVPYRAIRRDLSALGRRLVAAVRAPR